MKLRTEMLFPSDHKPYVFHGDHKDVRRLTHDAAAANALMQAMDAEPEYPDGMPDEMWELISTDRDAAAEAFRIAVRQTKEGIKDGASELMAEWGFDSGEVE